MNLNAPHQLTGFVFRFFQLHRRRSSPSTGGSELKRTDIGNDSLSGVVRWPTDVRYWGKADIAQASENVRFWG
jgi:hypothetical protein